MTARTRPHRLTRRLGWLAVLAMVATAVAIPAAPPVGAAAVDPVENDQACNNTNSGSDSPLVSLSISGSGLTVHWSQADPPDGFGTDGTVVVRACVTVGGQDQGAWSQNDENDGIELFPWSLFGLAANPCPGNASFAGSVDGGTPFVNTQKQNGLTCADFPTPTPTTPPTGTPTTPPTGTPTTPPTGTPTTPPTGTPTTPPTGTPTTPPTGTPTTPPTGTPTEPPTATPTGGVGGATATPTPAGGVSGATGTPPTLPRTDSIDGSGSGSTGDGWRVLLLALAGLLAGVLVLTPAKAVVRKDDAPR